MTDLLRIDIDGGKYTLVQKTDGAKMLRYGEPWLNVLSPANAILAMGYELEELRKLKEAVDGFAGMVAARIAEVKPQIVLGDDDSIHLTAEQQGFVRGLQVAAQLFDGVKAP